MEDSAYQVYMNKDCSPIYLRKAKIERMYDVKLLLGSYVQGGGQLIGIQGDVMDRNNAKLYMVTLVKGHNVAEQIIYLPPSYTEDDIERIERQTNVVVVPGKEKDQFILTGSNLTLSMALTLFEELVTRDGVAPETEHKRNKASRRLSTALHETLTVKKQKMGNCMKASDAVKRAIVSCLEDQYDSNGIGQKVGEHVVTDTDEDVILIDDDTSDDDGDTDDDCVLIDYEDSDDDVMIIETPRKKKRQSDSNDKEVNNLSSAFTKLKTPSKSDEAVVIEINKPMVAVQPLASKPVDVTKMLKPKTDSKIRNRSGEQKENTVNEDMYAHLAYDKDKNTVLRNGELFILDSDDEQEQKRRKIRSVVVVPGEENRVTAKSTSNISATKPSQYSKRQVVAAAEVLKVDKKRNDLRYIVIDGSNVAMAHSNNTVFSCKGIRICVDFFRQRGHDLVTVFLPAWRKCRPRDSSSVTNRYILDDLEKEGYLVYTPSRRIGNKLVVSYDDRFIIELCEREDGVIVSNDQYRDLLGEKQSWRKIIEERLLMYSFVRDHFMVPDDPFGRSGPLLSELLSHRTAKTPYSTSSKNYDRLRSLVPAYGRQEDMEMDTHGSFRRY